MTRRVVETFSSPREAAQEAADAILAALAKGVQHRGRASMVATGGRSPGPVYDALSTVEFPWEKVSVTLSDERWVDAHSPDSNERLVRDRLLTINSAAAAFTPLKTYAATPEEGARAVDIAPLLPFDVALLGMGEDGHIASLFPGNGALEEGLNGEALLVGVPAGEPAPAQPRISLTLKALLTARLVVLLISGEAKRRMIEQGEGRPVHALLSRTEAPVRVLWSA